MCDKIRDLLTIFSCFKSCENPLGNPFVILLENQSKYGIVQIGEPPLPTPPVFGRRRSFFNHYIMQIEPNQRKILLVLPIKTIEAL